MKHVPQTRYFDAAGSGMDIEQFSDAQYLIHLNLSSCTISTVSHNITLPNLRELDLSYNQLDSFDISSFVHLSNLRVLILSWNPITNIFASDSKPPIHYNLDVLYLSGLMISKFKSEHFKYFPNMRNLIISSAQFHSIDSLKLFSKLESIDMDNCTFEDFANDIYSGLKNLKSIRSSNFKLCCPQLLPDHMLVKDCVAPSDEISSCDNLLRSNTYRLFLWTFAAVAVVGKV